MAVSVLLRGVLLLLSVVLPCAAMMMSGRPETGLIGYGIPMYDVSVPPSQSQCRRPCCHHVLIENADDGCITFCSQYAHMPAVKLYRAVDSTARAL